MIWRLSSSVRSLLTPKRRHFSSRDTVRPLRILFCGSDEFSIASLRALDEAKHAETEEKLVESIEVVHRPGKPTGRGLKLIREVPIKEVAKNELSLATHEIDTFTGWKPPTPFDIIIAVSFGLRVPPRLLNLAQYGGLNVHPSLLPDLRGPAPIHHALLKRRPKTGITIQTLHPEHFDQGLILAQTPPPGLDIAPDTAPADLTHKLGPLGAEMLVQVLRSRNFVPPLPEVGYGWYGDSGGPIDHAGKITPAQKFVDFAAATAEDILTHHRVLGALWCKLPNGERLVLNDLQALGSDPEPHRHPGLFVLDDGKRVAARTADGQLVEVQSSTFSGGKKGMGNATVRRVLEVEQQK